MENMNTQWHSAFYAATRLELWDNADDLVFHDEYLISKKSLQADLLIIKKRDSAVIHNEIGKLFAGHNLIEYKSEKDTLSIDCFFKAYGCACLYKAATDREDEIPFGEITITFIRQSKPGKKLKWCNSLCIRHREVKIASLCNFARLAGAKMS